MRWYTEFITDKNTKKENSKQKTKKTNLVGQTGLFCSGPCWDSLANQAPSLFSLQGKVDRNQEFERPNTHTQCSAGWVSTTKCCAETLCEKFLHNQIFPLRTKKWVNKTRHDKTRQDKKIQDKTRQDKTRQDKTRQDKTRQD
jgi:hypothetical protein